MRYPLLDQPFHDAVEQLGEFLLGEFVALAAEGLEHFGSELPALDERVEDCLFERVERVVGIIACLAPERMEMRSAGESRLEEEVGQVVEQRLEIDCVSHRGAELGVRVRAHPVCNIAQGFER